jgi:hypothetical protein
MKCFILIVFTYICMYIGLVSPANAGITLGLLTLGVANYVDTAVVSHAAAEAKETLAHHQKVECMFDDKSANPQGRERTLSRGGHSETLVQEFGARCITPSGWCWLDTPMRIGSPCCCPFGACGRVNR